MSLITSSDLKTFTPLPNGLEEYLFEPEIPLVQQYLTEKLLGQALTDWLNAQAASGNPTQSARELLALVKPFMCWQTLQAALPNLQWRLSGKGLEGPQAAAGGTATGVPELSYMRRRYTERAETCARSLLTFLRKDAGQNYPLWHDPGSEGLFPFGLYIPAPVAGK